MYSHIDHLEKRNLYNCLYKIANIKIRNIDKNNYKFFKDFELPLHTALKVFIHQSGRNSVLSKEDMLYTLLKYDVIDVDLANLLFDFFDPNIDNSELYSYLSMFESELLNYCFVNNFGTDLNVILVAYIFHYFGIEFLYSNITSLVDVSFDGINVDATIGVELRFDNLLSNYMRAFLNNYSCVDEFNEMNETVKQDLSDEGELEYLKDELYSNFYDIVCESIYEDVYIFAFKADIRVNYIANMLDYLFCNNNEPESHIEEIGGIKYLILSDTTLSEYLNDSNTLILIVCMCVLYKYSWVELSKKQPVV